MVINESIQPFDIESIIMQATFLTDEIQQKNLKYALETISSSPVFSYVESIIIYGSCARGENREDSDLDIYLVVSDCLIDKKIKNEFYNLQLFFYMQKGINSNIDLNFGYEKKLTEVQQGKQKSLFLMFLLHDGKTIWQR